MTGLCGQNDHQRLGGKREAAAHRAYGQQQLIEGWTVVRLGFQGKLDSERAGQELALPQTQSNFCLCLPRTVQEVREILLMMPLPVP